MNAQEKLLVLRQRRERRKRAKGGAGRIILQVVVAVVALLFLGGLGTVLAGVGTSMPSQSWDRGYHVS